MKKIFIIVLVFFLTHGVSLAAVTDFNATSNVIADEITFGSGTTELIIMSGSTAEEVEFSTSLTITNPGSVFKVGSSDSTVKSLRITQNSSVLACEVNATPGTSFVSLPTTSGEYVAVPSTETSCPSSGGSASSGGGNTRQLRVAVSTSTPASSTPTSPNPNSPTPSPTPALFPKNLPYGSVSPDVTRLQTLLATDKSIYPEGMVTGNFGPLTKKAVEKFQEKYGIVGPGEVGYGVVGPMTREKLEEVFNNSATTPTPASNTPTPANTPANSTEAVLFEKNIPPRTASAEVRLLQTLLATDKEIYPEGTVTGFYGPLTRQAVEKFQLKYGIAKEGDTGFGVVGPKTRAKLNEVFSQ